MPSQLNLYPHVYCTLQTSMSKHVYHQYRDFLLTDGKKQSKKTYQFFLYYAVYSALISQSHASNTYHEQVDFASWT